MGRTTSFTGLILAGSVLLSACAGNRSADTAAAPQAQTSLDKIVLAGAGPQAIGVLAAKKAGSSSEKVAIQGKVKDFVDGMAVFTMVDPKVKSCRDSGHACPTPWDYCCIPKEDLVEATATVKVLDNAGQLVQTGLKGVGSIDHLTPVTVEGKAVVDSERNLVVEASNIYVTP
jgi:hypothetical protein